MAWSKVETDRPNTRGTAAKIPQNNKVETNQIIAGLRDVIGG